MARKTEKDIRIEALEAKLANQEEKKESKKRWQSLPQNVRIAIVLCLVILLILVIVYFYLEIRRVNEVSLIEESEYSRLLMVIDGVEWSASKSSFKILQREVPIKATGSCVTIVEGENIILELEGKEYGSWSIYTFHNGEIKGLLDFSPSQIFFSESVLKTGRALTLLINGEKVIFYQEEK